MKLKDKIGIVTGGANGIGRAIALGLAKEGAGVVVADIDSDQANKVADEIRASGCKAMAIRADVGDFTETSSMVKTVLKAFKKIDILVNNAGGSARERASLFCESTEEVWDYVFRTNLKSSFNCTRAIIEHMIERRNGKIVNIASDTGLVGYAGFVDYSAAKAGIIGFTHALAKEVASYGINVNAVAPGPTATRVMLSKLSGDTFKQRIGLGRLAKPEEIAAMVVFLTTEDADFITGQVIPVCGLSNLGTS
jgi:NAD(P)-dependent dehydrogenase (short-subunit alcohol dehydrogenase family)